MDFNPRSPRGERPPARTIFLALLVISIHAPREGSDILTRRSEDGEPIPIHAPREGERPHRSRAARMARWISIHAPREGSDGTPSAPLRTSLDFNPRSPRGERLTMPSCTLIVWRFQSTLPARGATCKLTTLDHNIQNISIHAPREGSDDKSRLGSSTGSHFNPRSPRGERRKQILMRKRQLGFQSTLPARGSDARSRSCWQRIGQFQSTLPARGATYVTVTADKTGHISIHAPREGSDLVRTQPPTGRPDFNPRSPRGERRD